MNKNKLDKICETCGTCQTCGKNVKEPIFIPFVPIQQPVYIPYFVPLQPVLQPYFAPFITWSTISPSAFPNLPSTTTITTLNS